MAQQTLILNIPDDLYHRLQQRAEFSRRTMEDELLDLLTTAMVDDEIPADIQEAVAALASLDDAVLWQTARDSHLTPEQAEEVEELHFKRQREGLTNSEQQRLTWLMHQYDKALLVRSHALGLLKERGHDIQPLLQQP